MKTICIMCPLGCPLDIKEENGEILVTGNTCKRGETYGKQEFVSPKRVVTSLVKLNGGGVTSVKTSDLIDKDKIQNVLDELSKIKVDKPVNVGDIIIKDILGLGVDILATRSEK